MTCAHCEELREEIAYLKSELGLTRDSSLERTLHFTHGLTGKEARFLIALHQVKGRVLNQYQVLDAIGSPDGVSKLATVYLCKIRKKLGRTAILTEWGRGFSIGPLGVAAIEHAQALRLAA